MPKYKDLLLGFIAGDIIGSIYESSDGNKTEIKKFLRKDCKFTDDSVLTIATADALISKSNYSDTYREYYKYYPDRGYGKAFRVWAENEYAQAYGSYANGAAMRVAPIGIFHKNPTDVIIETLKATEVTHNHPEAIKSAIAVAYTANLIFHTALDKKEIRNQKLNIIMEDKSFYERVMTKVKDKYFTHLEEKSKKRKDMLNDIIAKLWEDRDRKENPTKYLKLDRKTKLKKIFNNE